MPLATARRDGSILMAVTDGGSEQPAGAAQRQLHAVQRPGRTHPCSTRIHIVYMLVTTTISDSLVDACSCSSWSHCRLHHCNPPTARTRRPPVQWPPAAHDRPAPALRLCQVRPVWRRLFVTWMAWLLLFELLLPAARAATAAASPIAFPPPPPLAAAAAPLLPLPPHPPFAGPTAVAPLPANDAQPANQSFWLQLLQRHNSSGAVPPLPQLDQLLRGIGGDGLSQLAALPFTPAAASVGTTDFSTSSVGQRAWLPQPATTAGFLDLPALPSTAAMLADPSSLFRGSRDFFKAADSNAAFAVASGVVAGGTSDGAVVRRGIDWAALGIGSEQYEAAVLAVRIGMLTQMYGYLPFIGHQVGEAGFILIQKNPELAAALRGAQNQLIAVGLIGQGSDT